MIEDGDIVVTGCSGARFPGDGIEPGLNPIDNSFIDTDGSSLPSFNVSAMVEVAQVHSSTRRLAQALSRT